MFWMGVPRTEIPRAQLSAGPATIADAYTVLHPFAATTEKTWPAERFIAAAERLANPIFLAGPDDDPTAFKKFQVYQSAPLAEVKSLIAAAQLFIGNDSGPAHIAAAFGVPSVVLFGPSDPVTWAPWRTEGRVLTNLDRVSVADVIAAAESLRVRA